VRLDRPARWWRQQDSLRTTRQTWDAWNAHDPDSFLKLLDDDFVSESDTVPAPLRGREAARQSMQMYMKAFPELF
jgi:ketosteroid isomerase-like protein